MLLAGLWARKKVDKITAIRKMQVCTSQRAVEPGKDQKKSRGVVSVSLYLAGPAAASETPAEL